MNFCTTWDWTIAPTMTAVAIFVMLTSIRNWSARQGCANIVRRSCWGKLRGNRSAIGEGFGILIVWR